MLRCALRGDDKKWAKILPLLEFAYNSTQHSSSKHAPFELLYGFVPPKPVCQQLQLPTTTATDLLPLQAKIKLSMAIRELLRAQEYQKKYADFKRRPVEFKEGQRVYLKSTNLPIPETAKALRPRFDGPFRIIKMVGENAAMLKLPGSWLVHPVFHVSLLLPAQEEPPHLRRSPVVQDPVADNEYVIEAILDHRISRNKKRPGLEFQVLWLDGTTTWEPEEHLANAQETLRKYLRGRRRRQRTAVQTWEDRRKR